MNETNDNIKDWYTDMSDKIIGKVTGVMLIGIGVATFPFGIIFIIAGLIGLFKKS